MREKQKWKIWWLHKYAVNETVEELRIYSSKHDSRETGV